MLASLKSHVLVIDGMNAFHRARSGFTLGDHFVSYNFFRGLKALVEKFKPTRVYLCLEGHPQKRHEILPEYKANRRLDPESTDPETVKKLADLASFFRQVNESVALLTASFPVSVVSHPHVECDDLIYNLVKDSSKTAQFTIVSTDSDFLQLLEDYDNVSLYNPTTKEHSRAPENYSYLTWKVLRGDPTDNVPAVTGVTDKLAERLAEDPDALESFLKGSPERAAEFTRNYALIKFQEFTDEDRHHVTSSSPSRDWDKVKATLESWGFKSMTKDTYWEKFVNTFDALFP